MACGQGALPPEDPEADIVTGRRAAVLAGGDGGGGKEKNPVHLDVLVFGLYTGMRRGEIVPLRTNPQRWCDMNPTLPGTVYGFQVRRVRTPYTLAQSEVTATTTRAAGAVARPANLVAYPRDAVVHLHQDAAQAL